MTPREVWTEIVAPTLILLAFVGLMAVGAHIAGAS